MIGLAILFICMWANSVGALVPLLAQRFGIDPAVVSAPLISTLVDATGLVIFYTVAIVLLIKLVGAQIVTRAHLPFRHPLAASLAFPPQLPFGHPLPAGERGNFASLSPRWRRCRRPGVRATSRVSWQGVWPALAGGLVEGEPLHPQASLPEEPHLVVAALLGAGVGTLAADLDLAASGVDLEDLERLHQVGHPAGQPVAPLLERLRGPLGTAGRGELERGEGHADRVEGRQVQASGGSGCPRP